MQAIVCGFFWCYIMTMLPNQGGVLDWKELENRGSSNFYFFRTLSSAASPPTKHIPSLDAHDSSQECAVEIESDRCFPVSFIVTSIIEQSIPRMNRSVSVTY